jgi:hypothetical protein
MPNVQCCESALYFVVVAQLKVQTDPPALWWKGTSTNGSYRLLSNDEIDFIGTYFSSGRMGELPWWCRPHFSVQLAGTVRSCFDFLSSWRWLYCAFKIEQGEECEQKIHLIKENGQPFRQLAKIKVLSRFSWNLKVIQATRDKFEGQRSWCHWAFEVI